MLEFEDARKIIFDSVSLLGYEVLPVVYSSGRVLAEDIYSPWDMPGMDNSAMDGFAVRSEECKGSVSLKISGYQAAGTTGIPTAGKGTAYRISTGGPVPHGCDSIVPVELTRERDGSVLIEGPVVAGSHIRLRGEDVKKGKKVLEKGSVIRPPEVSMLASCGKSTISVYRRPKVAVLSTGDELIEVGEPYVAGKIYNSNSLSIASALVECGAEPLLLGIAGDEDGALRERAALGLKADSLITSAGVSMGDRDIVRDILESLGVEQLFWQVKIKPGKPIAFGVKGEKPVFSLPGNPVSAMVTFEFFVRPALLKMMGHKDYVKSLIKGRLKESIRKKAGRVEFYRVIVDLVDGELSVRASGKQQSGILSTMMGANAVAVLPSERTEFKVGEEVDLHLLYTGFKSSINRGVND